MTTVALVGNPNSGKSTLFNNLTGLRQHVGNWPGKTVEKKEGFALLDGKKVRIIDLPGSYGLSSFSPEESVARDFLISGSFDVVVQVIDASSIEKNLYLTAQLVELQVNLVIVLNLVSEAKKKGVSIDAPSLSELLGVPVFSGEVVKKNDAVRILDLAVSSAKKKSRPKLPQYGFDINQHMAELALLLPPKFRRPFYALALIEGDATVMKMFSSLSNYEDLVLKAERVRSNLESLFGSSISRVIADSRNGFISGIMKECVLVRGKNNLSFRSFLDYLALNRAFGIPFFLLVMYLLFYLTFYVAQPFSDIITNYVELLKSAVESHLASSGIPVWFISFLSNGLLDGVGSVISFMPNIFVLFFLTSFLEDSGYLARAAFVMDKLMHKLGLHGRSFIPMLLGFGCNVPAVLATRMLAPREKLRTMLLIPFMSCSARLPVYLLLISAFFTAHRGFILFSLYFAGLLVAILSGCLFQKTFVRGRASPFVMELPPYRMPHIRGILLHAWEKTQDFLRKAGTVIFSAVVFIWFLASIPLSQPYASEHTLLGFLGKFLVPVFKPLGFGVWQVVTSLIFGVMAKEVIVGSLATLVNPPAGIALSDALRQFFTPLSAYSFMLFVLLYTPCLPTIAAIRKETQSWKWPVFVMFYTFAVAWIISFSFYSLAGILSARGWV